MVGYPGIKNEIDLKRLKGHNMFIIKGRYRGVTEELDSADTEFEAEYLVNEYQLAYGNDWSVWYE